MADEWAWARALREGAQGAGEVAGTIGSGMIAQPLAGLHGVSTLLRNLPKGGAEALRRASKDIEETQERMTYTPRGDVGKRGLENIGAVMEPISKALRENIADPVGDVSPLLGAALVAAPDALPGPGKAKVPKVPRAKVEVPTAAIPGEVPAQALSVEPLAETPLLGRFATTTPGRIVNQTQAGGGYSVHLPTGKRPTEGVMMGKYANTDERNLVTDALTRAQLAEQVNKNRKALAAEETYLGTWRDPAEGGKTYVDVSRRFPTDELRQATKYGERSGQKAGYDVGKKEMVPVGNWEQFVNSPEFQQRLGQMEGVGREYLSQHPAKEWWDMHGSAFERVYGPENLPQVAGLVAATAPVVNPRQNLQKASEYLRRHIKGEPMIQPEWRMPEGMMNWQPGKRMGLEDAFAKNLERAGAGRLDELQKNKVREEAQALMGDPNAVVLDRHWARLAEDPQRGIYTAAKEGIVDPGKPYDTLKEPIIRAAKERGRDVRDFSADVWTGIRETIKTKGELYGRKFRKGAIQGESKSYADQFEDLIADKAKHMGITVTEMESRLRKGDATLLSLLAASPILAPVIADVMGSQQEAGGT